MDHLQATIGWSLLGCAGLTALAIAAYCGVRLVTIALDRRDVGARLAELETLVEELDRRTLRALRTGRPPRGAAAVPPVSPSLQGQAADDGQAAALAGHGHNGTAAQQLRPEQIRAQILQRYRAAVGGR